MYINKLVFLLLSYLLWKRFQLGTWKGIIFSLLYSLQFEFCYYEEKILFSSTTLLLVYILIFYSLCHFWFKLATKGFMLVPFWLFLIFQSANFISCLLNRKGWRSEMEQYSFILCHICCTSYLFSSVLLCTLFKRYACALWLPTWMMGALKDLQEALYVSDLAGHN